MVDASFLMQERSLPDASGRSGVVQWRVFRRREDAEAFVSAIHLGEGQSMAGGYSRDSVGPLWWVGVRVEDLSSWGNLGAINKHGS